MTHPATETVTTLRALCRHNDWARDQLLERAAGLDDARLDRSFRAGAGSLRGTLVHLCETEQWWLDRWLRAEDGMPGTDAASSIAAIRDRFATIMSQRDAHLDAVGAAGESTPIEFEFEGRPHRIALGDQLLHVSNHAIHHRAQAMNMLRHVGADVPRLDYLGMRVNPKPEPRLEFDVDTVAEYLRYSDWATGVLLGHIADLDDASLDRPFEMGPGSLRRTMLHLLDAESFWLRTWSGVFEGFLEHPVDTPRDRLVEMLRASSEQRRGVTDGLSSEDLGQRIAVIFAPGREFETLLGDGLLQLACHATHHRAQAVNMLRHLDIEVTSLDYVDWVESAGC